MSAQPLPIINPATGEEIARLSCDSPEDVTRKVARARAGQRAWAATPLAERELALRRFGASLADQRESLARVLTSEVGKPIVQARAEISSTVDRIDFFLAHTAAVLSDEIVLHDDSRGLEERITQEPLGVVANISAWNYPYFVGTNVLVPALLTGNAVVYKPSEYASLTGLAITQLLHQAGVPKDVMVPVIGAGPAGEALLSEKIDGVFFTGSYATGRGIALATAGRLLHTQLELGGKDPIYVCEDAPVATAVASLTEGAFYNTGQSCCAVERIYVRRSIFQAFVDAFVERVQALVVGDPADESTYIGPVTRPAQISHLEAQVRDAVSRGARVLCGGRRIECRGFYFAPTVLVDVDHSMLLMGEETFGPLIGIQAVDSDEEAIEQMNDTEYGLTAGVYSRDEARARSILARLDTGSVYWNCCDRVSPRLPWSGRGHSGLGVTLSCQGIRTFLRPKAWHLVG